MPWFSLPSARGRGVIYSLPLCPPTPLRTGSSEQMVLVSTPVGDILGDVLCSLRPGDGRMDTTLMPQGGLEVAVWRRADPQTPSNQILLLCEWQEQNSRISCFVLLLKPMTTSVSVV